MMAAYTLYTNMGREQATAAALALGYADANLWDERRLINFCGELLSSYFVKYQRCKEWQQEQQANLITNKGLLTISSGITRKFFGDPTDAGIQRQAVSMYGQAGTASNIIRCLLDWFWSDKIDQHKLKIFLQVHDSLVGNVRFDALEQMRNLLTLMEEPVNINGRMISVPAEAKIGFKWGEENMIKWYPEITKEEIFEKANTDVEWLIYNPQTGVYHVDEDYLATRQAQRLTNLQTLEITV